jgi:hypothetical protein
MTMQDRTRTQRLGAIVGRWNTTGHVLTDPTVPVVGTDAYEWLPGEHFLVHHVDVHVGDQHVQAIEIIGEHDPEGDGYLARSYDNDGNAEVMRLEIDHDGVFHFAGGPDIASAARSGDAPPGGAVRSTLTIASDRRTMVALWERADDGTTWEPWMDIHFVLADVSPDPS